MANKTLGINLQFNADVTTAVTNLRNLQQSITSIAATPIPIGTKLSAEMQTAVQSAKQLQLHITNAFNTKTGNLDLSKLNASLKASGQSLSTLSNNLLGAGMKGEQAFINIQRAISTANVQINTASTALGRFMTTMKNTAKWQLSSSLIHGFIGGIQSAIGYAKDLDKSLNSIRIVTGYSAEAMADFAKEANKAAKALNTTTTKYTDASLIYFQQGLDMSEVKERTETTIKLANVSRQSVEETSNQMTAIWNNFDNGTKSLEYYADVMTKLGAKTASSTKEIAGGLEKFAAIADTIGLSYEYAASALATITANTRQSEEVVGTALKTIFARIQGLKLGETLEDGVELNKYSEALAKIGVDILDVNDNLINADQILEKTAERWKTLSEAQKTATAQTVAGIRQYNQFIALMENWDDGTSDSMVTNLSTAFGAEGELQSQADRYAESWEAASAKLKASTENVWNNLVPTESLVDFTNGLSEIVDVLASVVRGFGGFQSILLLIANIALTKLGPSISIGIDQGLNKIQEFGTKTISIFGELGPKIAHPIASFKQWQNSTDATNNSFTMMNNHLQGIISGTGNAKKQIDLYDNSLKSSNQSLNEAQLSISKAVNGGQNLTATFRKYVADMSQVNNLQSLIAKNSHLLTASTKEQLSGMQQQLLSIAEKKAQEADTLELLYQQREQLSYMGNERMLSASGLNGAAMMQMATLTDNIANGWGQILVAEQSSDAFISSNNNNTELWANNVGEVQAIVAGTATSYTTLKEITTQIGQIYNDNTKDLKNQKRESLNIINTEQKRGTISKEMAYQIKSSLGLLKGQRTTSQEIANNINTMNRETTLVMRSLGYTDAQIQSMNKNATDVVSTTSRWKQYAEEYKNALANVSTVMQNGLQSALSWGGALQGLAQGASRVAMGINQIVNFAKQLTSGDADFTTILVSGTMALSMGLSGLMTLLGGINTLITTQNALKTISNVLDEAKIANITEETAAETAKIIVQKLGIETEGNEAFMDALTTALKEKKTGAIIKLIAAQLGLNAAMAPMLIILAGIVAAVLLVVGGLKLADAAYNADAKAAEKAGEAAQKAAKQFEEAQNKYNEFKDSISKYDEAVDGLAKLTKGTIEYKEQIAKANEEAMKLIDSQGLLYGTDYKYNQEGLIEFIPGKLEQAREEEFNNLQRMEANKSFTAQRAKTAQEKADLTEFARNNLNDDGWMQSEDWGDTAKAGGWALGGAALGAAIGTVIPGIGNAIGAAVGAAIGAGAGLIAGVIDVFTDEVEGDSSKNEIESMRKLAEAYDKKGDEALTPKNIKEVLGENNTILDDVFAKPTAEMTKALIEEKDSDAKFDMEELNDLFAEKGENITPEDLKAYFDQNSIEIDQASIDQMFESVIDPEVKSQIASLAANTAAIRAHIERTAGSANQDNEAYQRLSEEDQSIADKIIANRVDDALADKDSEAYAQLEKDAVMAWQEEVDTDEKGFFKGDDNLTYDKYMEITYGKDWKDNYKIENMGGTNATIYQKNEEGKWENIDPDDKKNTLSNDEVKEALVEYYAKQYGDADAAKLAEVNTAAAEVRANVGGIGTIADQDIKSAFASGETADLSFMTKEQVDELKAELENGTIKVTDEYKQLLLNGADAWTEAAHEARKEAEANSIISEGASKYGLDEKVLKAQAKMLQQTHKGLENNAVAAAEMAVANQRLNKGVNKLTDNWKDWNKTLRSSDKTTQDYAEAVVGVQDAMRDMFGLTQDAVIPEDFLQDAENLDLLDQVANGSEEAAQKLHFNLTKAQIEAETFSSDIAQNMIDAFDFGDDVDLEATFNEMKTQALNALNEIQSMANGVDIGAGLKDPAKQAEMAAKLNEYALAAGWTAEQMQSALSSVGVRAKITMIEGDPTIKKVPKTHIKRERVNHNPFDNTAEWIETTWVDGYEEVKEPTLVPQIDMEDPNNPGGQQAPIFEKVDMGNIAPSVTTGGKSSGGGGSKSKTPQAQKSPEHKKKSDELERYYEIDNAIEDQTNLLEELAIAKDEAWGADKLKAMQDEIKASKEELALGEERLRQIDEWLEKDKTKVASYGITFDEDGRINNLDEVWVQQEEKWYQGQLEIQRRERAYEEAKNADENYDADGSIKLANEEYADQVDKDYDEFMKAVEQYDNTLSEQAKQRLDNLQKVLEIKQQNYEELEYKIELKVELNENDIADIEHQLERLGDNNVYASAERIALIQKNVASYKDIANIQIEAIREAERLFTADEITKEDYMARLQEGKEALQDAEISIRDGIQQIGEELSNTFDLVDEKLDQQFTKFDRLIELMDHYKNVVSLTEGEASYKEFNKILKASQDVLRDRITADESEVAMWESRRKQLEADIATLPEDSPAKREAEEALQAIMEKEADAKSQLMADIEQLGEYAREIFENSIEQAMKDFEEEMFGRPLNSIIESIEMMNSRQEELLTTTNKIYETNKLIRSVEKDIEATTNNRAKQAYLEFQNKVKQKQEQNELTKFELDLLTAEYEMTKAQIALEEAQNAKDTVRLTRDAEGNYGYVYTANEDKVADAEQALDDATNNYYNTALEGAQKYQDQIYQHIQEWEEKVKEVYLDQTLSEEEKNKKIKEINDTYNTLITQDKNLYYMAVGAMQESAYNTQVDYDLKGIESAENWFVECDGFLSDLEDAQDEYDRNTKEVSDHTEENFGRMETSIRNTKIESEKLKNQIVNDLVPELDTTLKDSIDNATEAWWKYIEALQEVIKLTDEAMKKNHDTQLKENYKDNYAAEIQERLMNGADYSDYDIQRLLEHRWEKMGGVDNTDYAALIAAGGTPEQIALWEVLRRFKIEQTDWSASDLSYADEMREDKLDQNYAQLIINYLTSSPYGRWSDSQVQKYLKERQIKIDERGLTDVMSNIELKKYIAEQMGKKPEELFTGGYTGSWGPEGRLAVLHEKELVLNAEDTKNFLSATGILREISQMLDRDALIASLGAINLRAMTLNSPADQVLQQEVTIHADFPNVTDHNEIEIAIDNLINAASQHAYRT